MRTRLDSPTWAKSGRGLRARVEQEEGGLAGSELRKEKRRAWGQQKPVGGRSSSGLGWS